MGEFIDHKFIWAHELRTYCLPCPIGLYNVDRLPNEIGNITEAIDLVVQYKGHKSQSKFYLSSVGYKAIVLGHTWLAEHNPDINWCTGKVKLTRCPDYCGQAKSDSSRPDDNISVQLVETMLDTLERIHATTTISMWLAEAAKGDTPTAKLEEILLKPLYCNLPVLGGDSEHFTTLASIILPKVYARTTPLHPPCAH